MFWPTIRVGGVATSLPLACVCLLALACTSPTGVSQDLAAARERWSSAAIPSYQVTVYRSCECSPEVTRPVVVTVRNGVVESRRYTDTGSPVSAAFSATFPSVDELFGIMARAIASHVYLLDARYDPELGFPSSVYIDADSRMVDDETSYILTDFHVP